MPGKRENPSLNSKLEREIRPQFLTPSPVAPRLVKAPVARHPLPKGARAEILAFRRSHFFIVCRITNVQIPATGILPVCSFMARMAMAPSWTEPTLSGLSRGYPGLGFCIPVQHHPRRWRVARPHLRRGAVGRPCRARGFPADSGGAARSHRGGRGGGEKSRWLLN